MSGKSVVFLMLAAATAIAQPAWAQEFPLRPIRMLVAFAPGGNTDILARAVGQRMNDNWGKPVVVDNRPGGAGVVAAEIVARASPDGYTVFVASTGEVAVNPSLFRKLPYSVERDFAPVTLGTISPLLLVAHPSFPPRTVKELVDIARSKPRAYTYASVGIGSPMHLSGELFKMITGTDIVHVPYKGGAPATAALIGGQEAQFGFVGMGPVLPHVKAGRLRALAISTGRRSQSVPEVPTLQEQGVKDFDTSIWFAFFVPAKTPKSVVSKLNGEIVRILKLKDANDYLVNSGVEVAPGTPEELARFVRSETEKYRKIIEVSGTRLD
ncbi:MAG: tripartite tricarboxylate transporter substrate binding protein [Betaproteobacteria bacterium]|nr:tripartite tricarboxylate transporter substrate binding protein [Betaproteobacteria bacterium]